MSSAGELLATLAVIAAGALLGRIQFRGVRLDVAAVLLLGAGVAHFGVRLSPELGLFGLLVFLYTVGVQSGPGLRSLQRADLKLIAAGLAAMAALFVAVFLVGSLLGLPLDTTLGAAAGLFGSGAALAIIDPRFPGGGPAAGFAVSAPLASLAVMLAVQLWNARIAERGRAELRAWSERMGGGAEKVHRATLRVLGDGAAGRTLAELKLPVDVLVVRHDKRWLAAHGDSRLAVGDLLRVVGTPQAIDEAAGAVGTRVKGTRREKPEARPVVVRKFFVSNARAIDVPLASLRLRDRFAATITRVRRSSVELRPRPGLRFRWGDRVQVSVPREYANELRALFGDDGSSIERFAFPRAALVIVFGGLLGSVPIHLAGGDILQVGPALGVLVVSMLTGALHRTGPFIWSQSLRSTQLFSQIGLPLFLAEVGNASYGGLVSALDAFGPRLILLGLAPVVLVIVAIELIGRLMRFGTMTRLAILPPATLNTPALTLLQEKHREQLFSHVYSAVYPLVSVVMLVVFVVIALG